MSESSKRFFGPYQIKKYNPVLAPGERELFHQKMNRLGNVINWEIKGRTKLRGIRTYHEALRIVLSLISKSQGYV